MNEIIEKYCKRAFCREVAIFLHSVWGLLRGWWRMTRRQTATCAWAPWRRSPFWDGGCRILRGRVSDAHWSHEKDTLDLFADRCHEVKFGISQQLSASPICDISRLGEAETLPILMVTGENKV